MFWNIPYAETFIKILEVNELKNISLNDCENENERTDASSLNNVSDNLYYCKYYTNANIISSISIRSIS